MAEARIVRATLCTQSDSRRVARLAMRTWIWHRRTSFDLHRMIEGVAAHARRSRSP
jgi:hypothetical protein